MHKIQIIQFSHFNVPLFLRKTVKKLMPAGFIANPYSDLILWPENKVLELFSCL